MTTARPRSFGLRISVALRITPGRLHSRSQRYRYLYLIDPQVDGFTSSQIVAPMQKSLKSRPSFIVLSWLAPVQAEVKPVK